MNIAPYFVAAMNDWPLPDGPLQQVGAEVDKRYPAIREALRALGLQGAHDLFELPVPGPSPVGLYWLTLDQWNACTSDLRVVDKAKRMPSSFARGMWIESRAGFLLFPDDNRVEPNVSFFVPSANEERAMVMNAITVDLVRSGASVSPRVLSDGSGCTLAVYGQFGSRTFRCSHTGCRERCKEGVRMIGNAVTTIVCEC